jgi:hypothetical protein
MISGVISTGPIDLSNKNDYLLWLSTNDPI